MHPGSRGLKNNSKIVSSNFMFHNYAYYCCEKAFSKGRIMIDRSPIYFFNSSYKLQPIWLDSWCHKFCFQSLLFSNCACNVEKIWANWLLSPLKPSYQKWLSLLIILWEIEGNFLAVFTIKSKIWWLSF